MTSRKAVPASKKATKAKPKSLRALSPRAEGTLRGGKRSSVKDAHDRYA